MAIFERRKVLIVVRTYPIPATKGVEVSCTAAINEDGTGFLRLFPIPYRFLSPDKHFSKYQWIEVDVTPATSDTRPESFKIRGDSITIVSDELSCNNAWRARKDYVLPLVSPSLCALKRKREANGHPTLGIFKPKSIERLILEPTDPSWTEAQLSILRQMDLFQDLPVAELEKVPFKFTYQFTCDDSECKGHKLSCTDWEMGAAWRSWRDKYGLDGWRTKFVQKFEREMIERLDTHFFVGTIHRHPAEWIIVGLFYPPNDPQESLF